MPETVIAFRDLHTNDEFAAVAALERRIWGLKCDEVVPASILTVSVSRGGILIGAFVANEIIGFVYSQPGLKGGQPTQWSHMLGVIDEYRRAGVGHRLKLLQRERTLAQGLDLIEWTYDPLQAANAHLNFNKLGVVVHAYEENVYGDSDSPLHKGNPTDRFVAEWWIRKPCVEARLEHPGGWGSCASEIGLAPAANQVRSVGEWLACANVTLELDVEKIGVAIPMGFTDMLSRAPDLAREWRFATRQLFQAYFARGYQAVEFALNREQRTGTYLMARGNGRSR